MSFFDSFDRSAWRLETQPFYQPDAEEFHRYLQGLAPTAEQRALRAWWVEQVASRTVGRVLMVAAPLTPYWRWRLETGRAHVAAGEDIRIAIASIHAGWGGQDFWLLDDQRLLSLDFDQAGRFIGSTTTDDPATVRAARRQRDRALAASVPLQEFLLPA